MVTRGVVSAAAAGSVPVAAGTAPNGITAPSRSAVMYLIFIMEGHYEFEQ